MLPQEIETRDPLVSLVPPALYAVPQNGQMTSEIVTLDVDVESVPVLDCVHPHTA